MLFPTNYYIPILLILLIFLEIVRYNKYWHKKVIKW